MPKSKLSSKLEAELRERLNDELKQPPAKFPKSKQYSLEVTINGKKESVGYVDAGFDFGSNIVLCEIETMGFPAANLARMLCFCHHLKEQKEIYFFHFLAPTPYFNRWQGGWKITTEFLIERLREDHRVHYYWVPLEDNLPSLLRNLPRNQIDIDTIAKKFVKQILKQIKSIDKREKIGIPWKSSGE